jgi:hypothetical protein
MFKKKFVNHVNEEVLTDTLKYVYTPFYIGCVQRYISQSFFPISAYYWED